ncbi:MAG: hypothetical protein P857_285 [Candidatus Xenolissoclinum pacificiensis L6]|uniref:Transposase n=1 Tax=Candidatus Xenolissoclinum pacificiensis L6 TaxID=1401685 RepID=W2V144_9RICK|nr:MAG: hypothetical protein P857_285 [Candidatus Xenolissoclinum pacificiensis L6]
MILDNCGIRTIERLTGIHNTLISIWIEKTAEQIKLDLKRAKNRIRGNAGYRDLRN